VTAYDPPTRLTLQAAISRDIHDASNKTFSTNEVNDLINMGIAELNQLQPVEYLDDVALTADIFTYTLDTRVDQVIRVELWRDSVFYRQLPAKDGNSLSGWDFFGLTLLLPTNTVFDDSTDQLRVYGYRGRDPLTDDADVAEIDLEGETLIRAYAQFAVFERLISSRSLFQQWQTNSNNTDVSPTQLWNFANLYASVWRDMRMRMKRLRRAD